MYDIKEVKKYTLEYFNGDSMASDVWINKYALKDKDKNILELTPDDMHKRLAKEFARIESKYPNPLSEKEIFSYLKNFKYLIPQGGSMSGIGDNNRVVSLSNCFVVYNGYDSYGGIYNIDESLSHISKRRGGVGTDISVYRFDGASVKNAALSSTGPVPFAEQFSETIKRVAQNGRRGALMLSISIKHPDAEKFIDAKLEDGKIDGANISVRITDDFMDAVVNNKPFIQQFPVDSDNPTFTKEINARELWDKIVKNAWKSAEPGILFWDKIIKESPADSYADMGYKTVGTNPCIVGDTHIAVADGRGSVPIKELAKSGDDVPVYSYDGNKIVIKTMRHPRLTHKKKKIFKVTLDNGDVYRVTHDHVFYLKDGRGVKAEDLKYGDSLKTMTRNKTKLQKKTNYYDIIGGETYKREHRLIAEFYYGDISDMVIHHKDGNGFNNKIENLEVLTKEEHDLLHSYEMMGENNPYHKMSDEWKCMFASKKGLLNHTAKKITNDELRNIGIEITKKMGRRLSKKEWMVFAKNNNLPVGFSQFRISELGKLTDFLKSCAKELGFDYIDEDPRVVKTLHKALNNGYGAKIENHKVFVKKKCEMCGDDFWVDYNQRERSFCSRSCALDYINSNEDIKNKAYINRQYIFELTAQKNKESQLKIYSSLKFRNGVVEYKDWVNECEKEDIPHRLGTKYGFNTFKEIEEQSAFYNHKVISSVFDGYDEVYNGTVDDTHNYLIGTGNSNTFSCTKNCGELPLPDRGSCILLAINLYSYVINPFTDKAKFDMDLFAKHVIIAQRIIDDIVDLEIEKIKAIIKKVESDPEPDYIKRTELDLWEGILQKHIDSRRTGLGITALGDTFAALGARYGSSKSIVIARQIFDTLSYNSYKSSAILAKERGMFPIFDLEKERNNPFINRIYEAHPDVRDLVYKYGRRNIGNMTIAPTGSVSIETQTTSGIEPVYKVMYKRRRKINPNDPNARVDYIDKQGVKWEEYLIVHSKFKEYLKIKGIDGVENLSDDEIDKLIKESPYHKSTSEDINWVDKVKLQGVIQKYIDHAISATTNIPSVATIDDVNNIYIEAWRSGCKGMTIYRDGSRSGVMVDNISDTVNKLIKENNAPKRPKHLQCDIYRFVNNKENWIGFLGMYKNNDDEFPYELFTGLEESFVIPNYVDKGVITKYKDKNGKNTYSLTYKDKDGYDVTVDGLNRAFNKKYWNAGKLVSAMLRHRIHLPTVINLVDDMVFDSNGGYLFGTWQAGVKRILKKYLKSELGETCPSCGSTRYIKTDGCKKCMDCGYSACS